MNKALEIVKCKCPKCGKGNMFNKKGNIFLFKLPEMNKRCKHCDYKFEKETGFFFGAMFVSYAIAAAEMISILVLFWYLIDLSPLNVFFIIVFVAVLSSTFNFRLSRSIWTHIFYKN
ncbi:MULTISPECIES: DUF983 domain-containing protein [Mesonia]|uniref:Uncharacterized protein n=1 Tax=Mesonia oceanica TaxID=2687242 RepID=A0AC61Y965_9FLAO|nr:MULTISPECIES: DUF983 domain-containing protein [Mesonia]MAN28380.1 DUF983 domain-containing protein [Mesonia sp.]MAQ40564.1 DUF983 domain-containing protein [Mesonia sp.]VVV01054.1 hypothetical protein FVB9532_02332 [Mesonia oceanica]|tara:strand:- start:6770 stop:7120 length:351 start_codon:yes stop_codon:yes gene_type:complete